MEIYLDGNLLLESKKFSEKEMEKIRGGFDKNVSLNFFKNFFHSKQNKVYSPLWAVYTFGSSERLVGIDFKDSLSCYDMNVKIDQCSDLTFTPFDPAGVFPDHRILISGLESLTFIPYNSFKPFVCGLEKNGIGCIVEIKGSQIFGPIFYESANLKKIFENKNI